MAIIVQREGQKAITVHENAFSLESDLQEYIYANPEILPLTDIKEDIQFAVLDKETPVTSGYIDILGVDSDGEIYIIETKLFKNADKRQVLAQVLDYGAAIWNSYREPDAFLEMLDERLSARDQSLKRKLANVASQNAEIESNMRNNIARGIFKFIVLMDRVPAELKDLILYMNRNSNFNIYAIEFEHYKYEDLDIIVPHIFGAEGVTPSSGKPWNERLFFQRLSEETDEQTTVAVRKLYEFSKSYADEISWGRGQEEGSFNPKFYSISRRSLYSVWTNGRITINFGWLDDKNTEVFREQLRDALKKIPALSGYIPDEGLNKYPGVPAHIWVPISDQLILALKHVLTEKVDQDSLDS